MYLPSSHYDKNRTLENPKNSGSVISHLNLTVRVFCFQDRGTQEERGFLVLSHINKMHNSIPTLEPRQTCLHPLIPIILLIIIPYIHCLSTLKQQYPVPSPDTPTKTNSTTALFSVDLHQNWQWPSMKLLPSHQYSQNRNARAQFRLYTPPQHHRPKTPNTLHRIPPPFRLILLRNNPKLPNLPIPIPFLPNPQHKIMCPNQIHQNLFVFV